MCVGVNLGGILFKRIIDQMGGRLVKVVSAAAIPPDVARGFLDMGIEIAPGYGLSECAPLVAAIPSFISDRLRYKKIGSVGICIKSGQIMLKNVDEQEIGEIWFEGPNVMMGYYKMPELTAETIVDGWLNTGDLGFADDRRFLYITGRSKNVIVTFGMNQLFKILALIFPLQGLIPRSLLRDKACRIYMQQDGLLLERIVRKRNPLGRHTPPAERGKRPVDA